MVSHDLDVDHRIRAKERGSTIFTPPHAQLDPIQSNPIPSFDFDPIPKTVLCHGPGTFSSNGFRLIIIPQHYKAQ